MKLLIFLVSLVCLAMANPMAFTISSINSQSQPEKRVDRRCIKRRCGPNHMVPCLVSCKPQDVDYCIDTCRQELRNQDGACFNICKGDNQWWKDNFPGHWFDRDNNLLSRDAVPINEEAITAVDDGKGDQNKLEDAIIAAKGRAQNRDTYVLAEHVDLSKHVEIKDSHIIVKKEGSGRISKREDAFEFDTEPPVNECEKHKCKRNFMDGCWQVGSALPLPWSLFHMSQSRTEYEYRPVETYTASQVSVLDSAAARCTSGILCAGNVVGAVKASAFLLEVFAVVA
ncbi:hypothetical protein B0J11DRAFT_502668 [Dendryphion nanum]|uniref:Uncharacterized protein n=1 Tax=Dendryphion nanum TaxID=256645 RepID=A0A9P9EE83_9PLEO|nr:hypothetical protein B0J11DRAFT_502668 [Dendryphion nanum]